MNDSGSRNPTTVEVVIIGAGVAGLACARALGQRQVGVRVLEKSRGVGGRCATRRIRDRRVDHGLAFFHGDDPGFLAALHSVEDEVPFEWPRRIAGAGPACQPRALRPEQWRLAFPGGVSVFPKHLARGIAVDLETRVTAIESGRDDLRLTTEDGSIYRARSVVLALPVAQAKDLLRTIDPQAATDLPTATALLSDVSMVRCLTMIAGYEGELPLPEWEVCYPEESDILQMVIQDSTKRAEPAIPVFVLQGRPRWSAERWRDEQEVWVGAMLAEAAAICGDWASKPAWIDTQRWRYARLTGGDALNAPILIGLKNGSRLGIAGEAMAWDGGAQAAWLSGRRMARRLLGDEQG